MAKKKPHKRAKKQKSTVSLEELIEENAKKCPEKLKLIVKNVSALLVDKGLLHTVCTHTVPPVIEVILPFQSPSADPQTPEGVKFQLQMDGTGILFLASVLNYVKAEEDVVRICNEFNSKALLGRAFATDSSVKLDYYYPGVESEIGPVQLLHTLFILGVGVKNLYKDVLKTQA